MILNAVATQRTFDFSKIDVQKYIDDLRTEKRLKQELFKTAFKLAITHTRAQSSQTQDRNEDEVYNIDKLSPIEGFDLIEKDGLKNARYYTIQTVSEPSLNEMISQLNSHVEDFLSIFLIDLENADCLLNSSTKVLNLPTGAGKTRSKENKVGRSHISESL